MCNLFPSPVCLLGKDRVKDNIFAKKSNIFDNNECSVSIQSNINTYFVGMDIGFDASTVTFNFGSSLNLSQIGISGVFNVLDKTSTTITLEKPSWVNADTPGFLGLSGNDVEELTSFGEPSCSVVGHNLDCGVMVETKGSWYAGIKVGFDTQYAKLNFLDTGLDLADLTGITGNFEIEIEGEQLRLTKPAWVSTSNQGHLGLSGSNLAELEIFGDPVCTAVVE